MSTFYSNYDKRQHFNAPQFNRMRHRYRGTRETYKINLEIGQLTYSIHKLYKVHEEFKEDFIQKAELLLEGGDIGVNDESDQAINLTGLEDLVARVSSLANRVNSLDKEN